MLVKALLCVHYLNLNLVNIFENILNSHAKCNQIATNMPGIGSLIREIDDRISDIWRNSMSVNAVVAG